MASWSIPSQLDVGPGSSATPSAMTGTGTRLRHFARNLAIGLIAAGPVTFIAIRRHVSGPVPGALTVVGSSPGAVSCNGVADGPLCCGKHGRSA
jgi:hypothetical protein